MLITLSPAKNLDYETALPTQKSTKAQLLDEAQTLMEGLKALAPQDISVLMKISDKLGVLNYDRFQYWQQPLEKPQARPAVFAFNGDVYSGLDAYSLDTAALNFAQQHVRILSGLYGILRPLDLILPYRLEMGTKFANSRGANLYAFWGDTLTQRLNQQLKALNTETVVNLASNEYFKAVKIKSLQGQVITPAFKDWKNGQYKMISFYAKKARGLMTRFIATHQMTDAEDIKAFDLGGYGFNEGLSSEKDWVFTRKA